MAINASNSNKLGFLGEDFQFKLVHSFLSDIEFFKDLCDIIDQNLFTNPNLKTIVGVMREYYKNRQSVPDYKTLEILLAEKSHSEQEKDIYLEVLRKIHEIPYNDGEYIKELSEKFFKQQNMVRVANEIISIASKGDVENYDKCVEILNKALIQGTGEDLGSSVFDDENNVLSDDYRIVIPTGIGKIDETLEGGLGKGELGVIVGSSSFGKVQPYDSKVVTPDGIKNMGDIHEGDYVIGADGKPHVVTTVYPHTDWDFYKVTFSDGTFTECGMEHLWNVRNIFSKDKNKDFETLPLSEIVKKGLRTKKGQNRFEIPTCKPVEFIKNDDLAFSTIEDREKFLIETIGDENMHNDLLQITDSLEDAARISFVVRSLGGISQVFEYGGNYNLFIRWNTNKTIQSVEFSRKADGQCIMVDSEEHLYLTDDFIVTHNTSLTTAISSFASTYCCPQNNDEGFKVLQIVFEDRIKQIQRKHIGRITGIEAKDLSKPGIVDQVKEQLEHYPFREMMQKNLRIIRLPSGEKTADDIKRLIIKLRNNGFSPDLVIIDYFECLLCKGDSSDDKWEKEGKTMRKFESIAGELNIGIWIPVQGTKDSLNAEVVTMDKAGGSFKKIQIAHIVMSIARTVNDIENNIATIAILKNRAGKAGRVFDGVEFNNGTCRISTDHVEEYGSAFFVKQKEKSELEKSSDVYKKFIEKNK